MVDWARVPRTKTSIDDAVHDLELLFHLTITVHVLKCPLTDLTRSKGLYFDTNTFPLICHIFAILDELCLFSRNKISHMDQSKCSSDSFACPTNQKSNHSLGRILWIIEILNKSTWWEMSHELSLSNSCVIHDSTSTQIQLHINKHNFLNRIFPNSDLYELFGLRIDIQ